MDRKAFMNIAISSGKGGTGKTFVATNLAIVLKKQDNKVAYLDCDVEEPNGHLFLKPAVITAKDIHITAPAGVDKEKCDNCKKCVSACAFNAIASIKDKILFFRQLCHACGACRIACPKDAIIYEERKIGVLNSGTADKINIIYGELQTGEGAMTPRLISEVKKHINSQAINLIDTAPGTSCPVVEAISGMDLVVLVTDPTPFGVNDLKLSVDMCRMVGHEPVVLVNRADYKNNDLIEYCEKAQLDIIGEIPDDRQVAELYSEGKMAVKYLKAYDDLFSKIGEEIIQRALNKKIPKVLKNPQKSSFTNKLSAIPAQAEPIRSRYDEIIIISGKGGTGKTTIAGGFASLSKNALITDCDVDAADLHILLSPEIKEGYLFSGGKKAAIDQEKCTACGRCYEECRFGAVKKEGSGFIIDPLKCEGCNTCSLVCPQDAIKLEEAVNGELYVSESRFGPMVHAKLYAAEENSGKLVSLIRQMARDKVANVSTAISLNDGAPGTGCPVIASISGADYAVVVTEPTVSGIHDAGRVFELCTFFNIKAGLIVNKSDINLNKAEELKAIALKSNVDFLGMVPYDKSTTEAQMLNKSVIEYDQECPASKRIRDIWQDLIEKVKV